MRFVLRNVGKRLAGSTRYKVRFRFADGSEVKNCTESEVPDIYVHFKTRKSEWFSVLFFYEGLFDEYIAGNVDLEGENPLAKLMDAGYEVGILASGKEHSPRIPHMVYSFKNPLQGVRSVWQQMTQNNQRYARAKRNAEYHYSLHPKLFEYMLGPTVGYCEGYWVDGTRTLDQAKHNVYEYICKKLRLQPGDHVVEVGAGWGFLPIYMVKNYGVKVTVYNPVARQNDYMLRRFREHGVADDIRLIEGEHHDIMREAGKFDKFVSTGVHEHHGLDRDMYHLWWKSIATALKPGGIGLISTSSVNYRAASNYLSLKYTWPGGHLPSIPHEISELNDHGLMLIEIENLWPHYQKTVAEWRERFKKYWSQIQASDPHVFNERFRRHWTTVYLEGISQTFFHNLDNSHILFQKGRDSTHYPWTRECKYECDFRTGEQPVECYAISDAAITPTEPIALDQVAEPYGGHVGEPSRRA